MCEGHVGQCSIDSIPHSLAISDTEMYVHQPVPQRPSPEPSQSKAVSEQVEEFNHMAFLQFPPGKPSV